ncbi:MAG: hypothetical protein Q8P77_02885 [Candidatus Veblenbacteria bacterium]|nr:hypothetical protein [Candidatus Veblenbacteria bacterium]
MSSIERFAQAENIGAKADFFARPFDSEKINALFNEAIKNIEAEDEQVIYKEGVNEDLDYEVTSSGPVIAFYLKDKADNRLMNFKFRKVEESLCLEHREINKGIRDYGINGSIFLKKDEEFLMALLRKSDNKEIKNFIIDSGQTNVIQWAVKNGYHFNDSSQKELFEKIVNSENNEYIVTGQFKLGDKYNNYIFKKENVKPVKKYIKEQIYEGWERDDIDLRDFTVRFKLIKEIPQEQNAAL